MPEEVPPEQFWKLYEKLPKELQEAIFSTETAGNIWLICERNELLDVDISKISLLVGDVLLGLLPPEEFQKTLEKEVKLKEEVAKKVAQEINRFIFYPVKSALEELYKIEIAPPTKPSMAPAVRPREGLPPEAVPPEEKPKRVDIYREPIE